MNCLVYIRNKTNGVDMEITITITMTMMKPLEGGSTRLELTPSGGLWAGVKFGFESGVAIATL